MSGEANPPQPSDEVILNGPKFSAWKFYENFEPSSNESNAPPHQHFASASQPRAPSLTTLRQNVKPKLPAKSVSKDTFRHSAMVIDENVEQNLLSHAIVTRENHEDVTYTESDLVSVGGMNRLIQAPYNKFLLCIFPRNNM
ncbi:hypothetical protein V6N13_135501 [Hibiscus sabdariffa]